MSNEITSQNTQIMNLVLGALNNSPEISALQEKGKNQKSKKTIRPTAPQTKEKNASSSPPSLAVPLFSRDQLIEMLQKVHIKLCETQALTSEEAVHLSQDQTESLHDENIKKIREAAEKSHKASIGSIFAKVFGWIATVLAVVVSTIIAVVSFGTGAPLVGICAVLGVTLAITLTALSESGAMEKMTNALASSLEDAFKAFGLSDSQAKMASKIFAQIVIAAVIIVTEIALAVFSGGASAGELVDKLAGTIGRVLAKATKVALYAAQVGQQVSNIAGTASGTASAVYQYEAGQVKADVQENKAFIAKIQALLESEQETIRELIKEITQSYSQIQNQLQSNNEAAKKIAHQMSAV